MASQSTALNALLNTKENIFLTGKAGTGKSYVINEFCNERSGVVKLATTGIAAYNIHGQTIHSFFRLKPADAAETIKHQKQVRDNLQGVKTIIIDEVSMLRPDLLDLIDASLRLHLYNKKLPFAGVRIILVGDLYQLEPVMHDHQSLGYESKYFFSAKVFKEAKFTTCELDKIYRQTDDEFINILNKIRTGDVHFSELNDINYLFYRDNKNDNSLMLTTTNNKAEEVNDYYLQQNDNDLELRQAELTGEFNVNNILAVENLTLKEGCKVIILSNGKCLATEEKYYNGSIGIFLGYTCRQEVREYHLYGKKVDKKGRKYDLIEEECAIIKLDDSKKIVVVKKKTWENYRYVTKTEKDKKGNAKTFVELDVIGSFTQFPLKLGYAVTIHKSQGLTFDKINIDLGNKVFTKGQLYVALSRVRSLEGVSLSRKITVNDVQRNEVIDSFLSEYY